MKAKTFLLSTVFMFLCFQGTSFGYFEIQYAGEAGFYIGKPMIYIITADSNDDKNIGKEGTFVFGPDKVNISGKDYYDCKFGSNSSGSHFYMGINDLNKSLTQKGIKFGTTKIDIDPAISAIKYPLAAGSKWEEKTKMVAENITVPGLGQLPTAIKIDNVKASTNVSAQVISVPAGTFNTLLVETTYTGTMIGIPMTLIQRTWMNEDNVAIKRNFEFIKPTKMVLYELQLSKPNPNPYDLNWDNVVNVLDLLTVAKYFNKPLQRVMIPNPDIDGNGKVDLLDLKAIASSFGKKYEQ